MEDILRDINVAPSILSADFAGSATTSRRC